MIELKQRREKIRRARAEEELARSTAIEQAAHNDGALPDSTGSQRFVAQVLEREANKPLAADEGNFRTEVTLENKPVYWWLDKYRPRKPRYFNRVKTGYDWNKYNQAHYDKDNPPPKSVQGYKFNIFYPDLIDLTTAPKYRIEDDPSTTSSDYCIIRFMAGPPYEDLAFKIVRKQWEFSRKRGYKCVFDRGILQLHFNFKRFFYRR